MQDTNRIIEIGRLTSDVTENCFGYLQNGTAKLQMTIAVNRSYKNGGEWVDEANFFDFVIFGKYAEMMKTKLYKGLQICVEGQLRQDRWKDNNGNNRSKIYIVADAIQTFPKQQNGGSVDNYGNYQGQDNSQNIQQGDLGFDNGGAQW